MVINWPFVTFWLFLFCGSSLNEKGVDTVEKKEKEGGGDYIGTQKLFWLFLLQDKNKKKKKIKFEKNSPCRVDIVICSRLVRERVRFMSKRYDDDYDLIAFANKSSLFPFFLYLSYYQSWRQVFKYRTD